MRRGRGLTLGADGGVDARPTKKGKGEGKKKRQHREGRGEGKEEGGDFLLANQRETRFVAEMGGERKR